MSTRSVLAAAAAAICISTSAKAVDPLLWYNFDEGSGTSVNNGGTAGDAGDMTMGAAVTWVSGVNGTAYQGIRDGTSGPTSFARTTGPISALTGATGLTITGWMNLASWNGGMQIINYFDNTWPSGFWLNTSDTAGKLNLTIGNNGGAESNSAVFDDNFNGWLFFAASWNGGTNSIQFYKGTLADAATAEAGTVTGNGLTPIRENDTPVAIGSGSADSSWWLAFSGALDDVRVYNSTLSGSEIEAVRASAVPEPGAAALLMAGLAGLALKRRRA